MKKQLGIIIVMIVQFLSFDTAIAADEKHFLCTNTHNASDNYQVKILVTDVYNYHYIDVVIRKPTDVSNPYQSIRLVGLSGGSGPLYPWKDQRFNFVNFTVGDGASMGLCSKSEPYNINSPCATEMTHYTCQIL